MMSMMVACTIPKKYQKGKPFIYSTDVILRNSDLPNAEKLQLRQSLRNQVDDSLQVPTVLAFRALPPWFYYRLSKPAVFDSTYIGRSKTFMNALLNSRGYFSPVITDTFWVDTLRRKNQMRTYVKFFVSPGVALRYDSIGYDMQNSELQQLAMQNLDRSLLQKSDPYSVQNISLELDRLLNIYRDHGYLKINKEDLYAELDTVVAALIDPGLDPFEQFQLIDSLSKKSREPTIKVVFRQRTPKDSSHLEKYSWGNIHV